MNLKKLCFLGAGAFVLALIVFFAPLRPLNDLYYDVNFSFRSPRPATDVVIVGVDNRSIDEYGGWPWQRGTIARLMEAISRANPCAVAVDLMFPPRFDAPAANDSLAGAFASTPRLVLPFHAAEFTGKIGQINEPVRPDILAHRFLILRNPDRLNRINFFSATRISGSDTLFTGRVGRSGFINVTTSTSSQRLREIVQVIRVGEEYFPSFGLAAASAFLGIGIDSLVLDGNAQVLAGSRAVPITTYAATTPVNYRGRAGTITTLSAVDVIKGTADFSLLRGKLVFVGIVAPGSVADFFITPVGSQFPGVEIWANAAADIMNSTWIKLPSGLLGLLNWLVLFLIFPGLALLVPSKHRVAALLCGAGITIASLAGGIAVFQKLNCFWDAVNHVYAWLFSLLWIAVQKADPSLIETPPLDFEVPQNDTRDILPLPREGGFITEVPACSTAEFVSRGSVTKNGTYVPVPATDDFRAMAGGTIVKLLGSGGMADVYLVWNPRLEVYRAVKVLKPGQEKSLLERFETEIRIFSKLNHPNIVQCYGVSEWHTLPSMEMEYVHGAALAEVLGQCGALPAEQALAVGALVCKALSYAHGQVCTIYGKRYNGVMHRDLKPGNILLSRSGRVKLADFGIARPVEASLHTQDSGNIVGTLPYIAPEQLDSEDIGPRVDIYALGATLYELLTCTYAFPPDMGITAMIKAKTTGDFKKLDPSAALPAPAADAIMRAMATNPAERFESAAAFGKSLENCLKEMPAVKNGRAFRCLQDLAANYWRTEGNVV
jgi:CHASE2 domain-containing sensor protein